MSRAAAVRVQVDETYGVQSNTPKAELTGKMVYMFLTGMVKDKVGYLIREICKNAWEVGDFEVHLPTEHSPTFRVRDYGPGLSHHFMMHRYPKLGDSTKDEEGVDGMSGWGAGSKSPLAYLMEDGLGGAYSVTSYVNGAARFYSINLDEMGNPQITLMGEMDTDEPNGLEVSVPVRRHDFRVFEAKARDILWAFEPRPKIVPDLGFGEPEVTNSGEGWTLYHPSSVPWNGPHVRAGCVMYPIRMNEITGLSGFLNAGDCVVFDVDPALIEVTSSREDLQYTTGTKETLTDLAKAYESDFIAGVQAKVNVAASYFKACRAFHDSTVTLGHSRRQALMQKITWQGIGLRNNLNHLTIDGIAKFERLRSGWETIYRFEREDVFPEQLHDAKIVIEHVPNHSLKRFNALGLVGQHILWARVHKDDKDRFMAALGLEDDDVFVLDSVKIEVRRALPNGDPRPKTMRVRRVIEGENDYRTDVDMALGGYYMDKVRGYRGREQFQIGGEHQTYLSQYLDNFQDLLKRMTDLGIWDAPPTIMVPNLNDELGDNWIPIGRHIETLLRENVDLDAIDLTPELSVYHLPAELRNRVIDTASAFEFGTGPEDLRQFQEDARALHRELSRVRTSQPDDNKKVYDLLSKIMRVELPEKDKPANPISALEKRWSALKDKYPLVPIILNQGWYYSRNNQALMNHYLELLTIKERMADHDPA